MSTSPPVAPVPGDAPTGIAALRHRVDGKVLTPGDAGFDEAVLAWNRTTEHHPAVVVLAENVGDVIATVTFAQDLGIGLGVQSTGHGGVVPVDGVLLVTTRLQDVCVDVEERTAWVAAGCTWGDVVAATQVHGLAPLAGSSPTVGAIGSVLGGGLGWLARRYGPACDTVRSFEVVLPDGSLVRTCRDENRELFRALRGGGGALGVVTDMEIDLVPVTKVYGGNLSYPPERAAEVVARYAGWVADAPDDLTSSIVWANQPSPAVIIRGCWCGDLDEGRALLDAWRAVMPPEIDEWDEMSFADVAAISNDPVDPMPCVVTGGWLDRLDDEVGEVLSDATFGGQRLLYAEVRQAGGAVAAGGRAESTMGNRDRPFLLHLVGIAGDSNSLEEVRRHQQSVRDRLGASERTYLNFLEGAERRKGAPTSIDPADLAEIAALRRQLDPGDLLRFGVEHT